MKYLFTIFLIVLVSHVTFAQDDLDSLFGDDETTEYSYATFKASRIILGQSVEQPAEGNLIFDIQHQFGTVNSGFKEFFGLDQATTRLGLTYGLKPWLMIGLGRTAYQKVVDGSIKIKFLRQSKGDVYIPLSVSYYGNMGIDGLDYSSRPIQYYVTHRFTFVNQLLLARKFSSSFSVQLSPTHIHRNLVEKIIDENDLFALGLGGRIKLNNRISINLEYFYMLSKQAAADFYNPFNISFDIETGGHIFQLYFSNGVGMLEQQYVAASQGNWFNGDIHFGFNISRTFVVKKPKAFTE